MLTMSSSEWKWYVYGMLLGHMVTHNSLQPAWRTFIGDLVVTCLFVVAFTAWQLWRREQQC